MDSFTIDQAERTKPDEAVGGLCVSGTGRYKQDPESYGFFNDYGHSYVRVDGSCRVCRTIGTEAAWRTGSGDVVVSGRTTTVIREC